jgi:hypothetical protein
MQDTRPNAAEHIWPAGYAVMRVPAAVEDVAAAPAADCCLQAAMLLAGSTIGQGEQEAEQQDALTLQ